MVLIKNDGKGKMYPWTDYQWNPIKGRCPHQCCYCYMNKYPQSPLRLDTKCFNDNLGTGNKIFVVSGSDLFAEPVPDEWISTVLEYIKRYPKNIYLIQSKNPKRFLEHQWSENIILGTTIETNRDITNISKAPNTYNRYQWLKNAEAKHKMVSIEPIIDFDASILIQWMFDIQPDFVSIGADSQHSRLQESKALKILSFIDELKFFTDVQIKRNNYWGE